MLRKEEEEGRTGLWEACHVTGSSPTSLGPPHAHLKFLLCHSLTQPIPLTTLLVNMHFLLKHHIPTVETKYKNYKKDDKYRP